MGAADRLLPDLVDHAGAERWGREAVADTGLPEPSREVALLVVGRSVLNLDRPKEALRVLRPLRKPKYIGWLRDAALAEAHLEADQPEAAQAAVDRVLGAVDVPEAHYLAARILWHRDQLWSALEQVMLYRASQPDDPSGLLLQGSILGFLGDAKSYPGAHEAALELFARALTAGGCEAVRLHGVTAARIGRWKEAMEDARRLRDHSDGHDIDHHRDAVEAIVSDVFSNLPDDADWGPPTSVAEELLGTEHEMVRLQRALVAGLSARSALERLAEAAGSTGEVAAIANRLLQALVQANEPASISGTAVGGFTWSDVARRNDPLSAVDSTWEGSHTPSSAVMDRMTRAFLH